MLALSINNALEILNHNQHFDLIITDLEMSEIVIVGFVTTLRQNYSKIPVIL